MKIDFQDWEIKPPLIVRWLLPGTIWRMPVKDKRVFITFDDGPIPEVTPLVLECLRKHNAVATFFCVGDNIRKHPQVFQMLKQQGMSTGNHSFSHMKAWSNKSRLFFDDINKCQQHMETDLFRPPHGQLYPWQIIKLKKRFRHIIMWDILSMDYRNDLTSEDVKNNVIRNIRPGSIIVFHDSLKAWPRLKEALPKVLVHLHNEGYVTDLIV